MLSTIERNVMNLALTKESAEKKVGGWGWLFMGWLCLCFSSIGCQGTITSEEDGSILEEDGSILDGDGQQLNDFVELDSETIPPPIITGPNTISWMNVSYRVLDEEGVYFVDQLAHEAAHPSVPYPTVKTLLNKRFVPRSVIEPIIVELTDFIDCSKADHQFTDANIFDQSPHPNKPSRLKTIAGKTFRVTAAPDDGFATYYYIYDIANGAAGTAHLLQAESINDQERYTSIVLNSYSPDNTGAWNSPYSGEPANPWTDPGGAWWEDNDRCTGQAFVFEPDVGVTFYTGRDLPIDNQPFNLQLVFHPKSAVTRMMVSSLGCNLNRGENDGGAVSQVWVWKFRTPLDKTPPSILSPTKPRHLGIYLPHSWYLFAHTGTPVRTAEQRAEGLLRLCQHLRMAGLDWLEFNAINGSDRSEKAWYQDSAFFPWRCAGDLLAELPPVADHVGIQLVPVITSLKQPPTTDGISWSNDSFQMGSNASLTQAFNNPVPDPIRPEVQETILRLIDEIAIRTKASPSVQGIGIRVSGKIGLAYAANQDGLRGSKQSGYSTWDLQQFQTETGIAVPTQPVEAYQWLTDRPQEWKAWIDFRCRKMRDFWLTARDRVRAHRSDWKLFLKTVLPAEVPGTNIEWANGESPIELLRHTGYDPNLYTDLDGIVVERTMMIAEDRFFVRSRWADPWGANHDRYRDFHYVSEVAHAYQTKEGSAVDLYHNYWEEPSNPFFEYGVPGSPDGFFRTNTPTAYNRNFFRPITFSIRKANANLVVLTGWERATVGQEHRLRHFAQAFRSLPDTTPRAFEGVVQPSQEDIWAAWFNEVLALVNDNGETRELQLTWTQPVPSGKEVVDIADGLIFLSVDQTERTVFKVTMEPWSLRVLRIQAPP